MTFGNGQSLPDVNGKASVYGGAAALVLVYAAGLAGVNMPAEVASAITLLAGGALGVIRGDTRGARAQDRRSGDASSSSSSSSGGA